jgi:creatinine amidohydrolase/Fe(II)-dependent formamide hydrolase-like protein
MKDKPMNQNITKLRYGLLICLSFIYISLIPLPAHAAASVFIDELTWMEVRDRIKDGATTVIIPTGGTGQEGPQMVEGKHTIVARYAAGEIAKALGNTLVTPVVPFVPEGRISPPEGHMQFAGTLSLSGPTFAAVLEDLARSLKSHGFKRICFVGDHGGAQPIQKQVADKLNAEWESRGIRVIQVSDYYYKNGQEAWTNSMGIKIKDPGVHGGHIETSELMALAPHSVRENQLAVRGEYDYKTTGAMGDSSQASAKLGQKYLSLKIQAAVRQIENADDGN